VRLADGMTRVFCFGIGADLNARSLDRITEQTKAASQYVLPEENIEVKVSSFFDKIREPVLTDLHFKVEGNVRVHQLYPGALPDLFAGEQLVIFGRDSGGGDAALLITGNVNSKKEEFLFEEKFAERADAYPFIARLWATLRVGFLLDQIRLIGESQELKDEIVALSRDHGIVTPYTSYLILEDDQRRLTANPRTLPAPTTPALQLALAQKDAAKEARQQWLGMARAEAVANSAWRANFTSDAVN
jgi:Ca-activated chloride channel family protein